MKKLQFIFILFLVAKISFADVDYAGIAPQIGLMQRYGIDKFMNSWGIQGRLKMDDRGVDIEAGYLYENHTKYGVRVNTLPLTASYLYYPTYFLYLKAGAGFNFVEYIESYEQIMDEYKHETIGVLQFGVGGELELNSWLLLNAETRYVLQDSDVEYLPLHKDFNYYFWLNFNLFFKIY